MAGLNFKDRISINLSFNGKEFPLRQNTLGYVHMVESARIYLPMLVFQITDATKFLTRNSLLQDGTKIQLIIGGLGDQSVTYNFRLFSHTHSPTSAAPSYVIRGYLDVPQYWNQSVTAVYKGTSSGVLKQISSEAGLTFEGVSTADNQSWIPHNKVYKEFARMVAERGYVDDSSCMQLAVSLDAKMLYRNVSNFESDVSKEEYVTGTETDNKNVIVDYNVLNKAGFYNSIGGYADKRVQPSLIGDTKISDSVPVPRNSQYLMMDADLQSRTTQGQVRHAPVDAGNVHENYEQALYQNRRLANLFGFGIEIVTPRTTTAGVLDVVKTALTGPGISSLGSISGQYLVTSKVIYIQGLNYYEKLELYRHGFNKDSTPGVTQVG